MRREGKVRKAGKRRRVKKGSEGRKRGIRLENQEKRERQKPGGLRGRRRRKMEK